MMMEILKVGGVQLLTDNRRKADDDNPRGYYEFEKVKKIAVGEFAWLSDAVGKAVKIISPLLPYLPDEYLYKVILMKRDLDEILASQYSMLISNKKEIQVEDDKMRTIFDENTISVTNFMDQNINFSYIICDYNQILADPSTGIEPLVKFLGLSVNISELVKIVDPLLYRHRN